MKPITALLSTLLFVGWAQAQVLETYRLRQALSNRQSIVYTRVIRYDGQKRLFHVRDYFRNGRIQMDAFYTAFDKRVKEGYQCNYRSNTKEGPYMEWHPNGRKRFEGRFTRGRLNGASTAWHENGRKEAQENWLNGQLHGRVRYWSAKGELQFDSTFEHGRNQNRKIVSYQYLSYLPKDYEVDPGRLWPLVIYLHGGSDRGTDLKKLYSSGIPDQVFRGRDFPFIMLAPQCPEHLRWSTDEWFESFYIEAAAKYRIDADRVYLTGPSLGGSGTWYLAARYPGTFAAIAPISGFTSHLDDIDHHIDNLVDMPVWTFHGKLDTVVPFEETERLVKKLEGQNGNLRFSAEPDLGHEIHWQVYPGLELYDWLLRHDRRSRTHKPRMCAQGPGVGGTR
jgi:pimeloyl-ACP methyl ester carboxylesterase